MEAEAEGLNGIVVGFLHIRSSGQGLPGCGTKMVR